MGQDALGLEAPLRKEGVVLGVARQGKLSVGTCKLQRDGPPPSCSGRAAEAAPQKAKDAGACFQAASSEMACLANQQVLQQVEVGVHLLTGAGGRGGQRPGRRGGGAGRSAASGLIRHGRLYSLHAHAMQSVRICCETAA